MEETIKTNEEIEQQNNGDWIAQELAEAQENSFDGERLESFKPEENKSESVTIDITTQWQKWIDKEDGTIKKMIPVLHKEERKLFWLNTKNPIYKQLLEKAAEAKKENKVGFEVKILRTGKLQNTRYALIE